MLVKKLFINVGEKVTRECWWKITQMLVKKLLTNIGEKKLFINVGEKSYSRMLVKKKCFPWIVGGKMSENKVNKTNLFF